MAIIFECPIVVPAAVAKCKRTTVAAIGQAIATANTFTSARKQAHAAAKRQCLAAAKEAKKVRCPEFGGCDEKCRWDGTMLVGIFSPIVTDKRKLGPALWQVSSIARRTFDVNCRCPGHLLSKKKKKAKGTIRGKR